MRLGRRPNGPEGPAGPCVIRAVVELSVAMADYIENFYNPMRRDSSLNYYTPEEFENLQLSETQTTLA